MEDNDSDPARGLDRCNVLALAHGVWLKERDNPPRLETKSSRCHSAPIRGRPLLDRLEWISCSGSIR